MVVIYPVLELRDLLYAHRYGWLEALAEVTEGIMLRPEPELGQVFRLGKTVKEFLAQEWGLPREQVDRLKIMLDHGINSPSFRNVFGLDKTPRNVVYVYHRLGVDLGIAFDVPVRLYISAAIDIAVDGYADVDIDVAVKDIVEEIAETVKKQVKSLLNTNSLDRKAKTVIRRKAEVVIKSSTEVQKLLRKLSRVGVEETVRRLEEMAEYSRTLGFKGLVPVVQGLFNEDIEYCVKRVVEAMTRIHREFLVAIGTGGKVLSREDTERIKFAIGKIKEFAAKNGASVKIHLLGWSSPNRLQDAEVLKNIDSADSLTVRRRAVEGRVFIENGRSLELVHVSTISENDLACDCLVCNSSTLRRYVLDPSGARRNDARIVHNIYVITRFLNKALSKP